MGKTVRVYLGVAVVAVIGLIVAVVTEQLVIGLAIVVIAGLGGMFLLRQTTSEDDEEFFEAPEAEHEAPPRPSSPSSEPLATWEPEGLTPWTPPEASASSATALADEPAPTTFDDDLDSVDLDDLQHLDALVADSVTPSSTLDDDRSMDSAPLDGSAFETETFETFESTTFEPSSFETSSFETETAERAEADSFANSMFGGGASIEENVHSDDDIMAASHATELTVVAPEASDNSELAKLLAKVQSRLAAYE